MTSALALEPRDRLLQRLAARLRQPHQRLVAALVRRRGAADTGPGVRGLTAPERARLQRVLEERAGLRPGREVAVVTPARRGAFKAGALRGGVGERDNAHGGLLEDAIQCARVVVVA